MLTYKCTACGKRIEMDLKSVKKIICPFCGYRIIEKTRSAITEKISTG